MQSANHAIGSARPLSWFAGLDAFFHGIWFILATPRSWPYAIVPMVVMALLSITLTIAAIFSADWLGQWLFGTERGTWGGMGYWGVVIFTTLVGLVLAVLLALVLAQPLSGFSLEAIVRLRERALTGEGSAGPNPLKGVVIGARVAIVTLVLWLVLFGVFWTVSFFFPPAAVVTVPLNFLGTAWLLAWNFVDYPLGLRSFGFRKRLRWAACNLGAFTVYGTCWSLVIIIPGSVLFLLPMGVAGATELVVGSERELRDEF